ncbi:MAG TPA: PASTA domain-containing protein [Intrasporangium sp.]|uniref:PASTA domain-containing protein n=1 Tax=Intrasporangium sp. TaxID=1925024 RepID=UPI002B490B54|nr:PASTA domain-containing protein [Intrasporangium sp.]HKX68862.1 PASTA domain-containing protein [Intrasporangium sp.]
MTVTATSTVTETVSAAPTKTSVAPAAAAAPTSIAPAADSNITVPNGIGLNYQEAQDSWRAAGLHVAPANDATGANRLPVLDSNWVVVGQDLKPGSMVAADSFITATVKKYTDD